VGVWVGGIRRVREGDAVIPVGRESESELVRQRWLVGWVDGTGGAGAWKGDGGRDGWMENG
jgi:hypothetical protein